MNTLPGKYLWLSPGQPLPVGPCEVVPVFSVAKYPGEQSGHTVLKAEYPWADPAFREQFLAAFAPKYEAAFGALAPEFAGVHGVELPERSWRILLGPTLLLLVGICHDTYARIEYALRKHELLWTNAIGFSADLFPENFNRLVRGYVDLQIHYQTASLLCQALAMEKKLQVLMETAASRPERLAWHAPTADRLCAGFPRVLGPGLRSAANQALAWMLARRKGVNLFFYAPALSVAEKLLLGVWPHGRVAPLKSLIHGRFSRGPVNLQLRSKLGRALERHADPVLRLVRHCLPCLTPRSLLEDFAGFWRETERVMAAIRPRACFSRMLSSGHEPATFPLALLLKKGVPIHGIQHGGGYGIMRHVPEETHERLCSDKYLTFGWKNDPADFPMPIFRGTGLAEGRAVAQEVKRLLFVSSDRPVCTHKIQSHPLTGEIGDYFSWQAAFYDALVPSLRAAYRYRPLVESYGHGFEQWYLARVPAIVMDHLAFGRSVRRCNLVVFDHNGTGLLQTLAANIPTILYWDPRIWGLSTQAQAHFDALREVGVFHPSPERAAQQVQLVAGDLGSWWNSSEVQAVRRKFCATFFWDPPSGLRIWNALLQGKGTGTAASPGQCPT